MTRIKSNELYDNFVLATPMETTMLAALNQEQPAYESVWSKFGKATQRDSLAFRQLLTRPETLILSLLSRNHGHHSFHLKWQPALPRLEFHEDENTSI